MWSKVSCFGSDVLRGCFAANSTRYRGVYTLVRPGSFTQRILFEDNHVLVVSKPPGMLVQADKTGDTSLLEEARAYIERDKPGRGYIGLVHRIDRPCSGVVLFAKTSKAAARLCLSFRNRQVKKHYACVVNGHMKNLSGCLHNVMLKGPTVKVVSDSDSDIRDAKKNHQLVEATLSYSVVLQYVRMSGRHREQSLLLIDLKTGRKHQIRSQLSSIGHPIVGDRKYMAPKGFPERDIALHAAVLSFPHPVKKEEVVVCTADPPFHWKMRYGDEVVAEIQRQNEKLKKMYCNLPDSQ